MNKKININYFDLGTHREGLELESMLKNILPKLNCNFNIYGVEADPEL